MNQHFSANTSYATALLNEMTLLDNFVQRVAEVQVLYNSACVKVKALASDPKLTKASLMACLDVTQREFELIKNKLAEIKRLNVALDYAHTDAVKTLTESYERMNESLKNSRVCTIFLCK